MSVRFTMPRMQPRGRSSGTIMPSDSQNAVPRFRLNLDLPAIITRGPRYAVRHERFSIDLWPSIMAHAHGCLITRAFMFAFYSRTNRLSALFYMDGVTPCGIRSNRYG